MGSEVGRQAEGSKPTQPNPDQINKKGRPVETEQTSRTSAQEIDTRFSISCENTNSFVERVDEDKEQTKTKMQIELERTDPLVDTGTPSSRR